MSANGTVSAKTAGFKKNPLAWPAETNFAEPRLVDAVL
jgi:hypothetical protein